ncbi:hypothetical protein [Cupriavidus taiwanensis]|uniref:hypothetical protein n=1 Tax=Cupriavidus taiwanensis TaxID=164546 RepID=UPI000E117613|nr:hypothetical protein [Cupriavidus taiwanensis]SPA17245.1 conserved hypothetical protein [Cupriavidus taiwanensis]
MPEYIDCTPDWLGLLPLLVEAASNGNTSEGRKAAWTELQRMAKQADAWRAHCKEQQPSDSTNE